LLQPWVFKRFNLFECADFAGDKRFTVGNGWRVHEVSLRRELDRDTPMNFWKISFEVESSDSRIKLALNPGASEFHRKGGGHQPAPPGGSDRR
jgi:hypothetical protein